MFVADDEYISAGKYVSNCLAQMLATVELYEKCLREIYNNAIVAGAVHEATGTFLRYVSELREPVKQSYYYYERFCDSFLNEIDREDDILYKRKDGANVKRDFSDEERQNLLSMIETELPWPFNGIVDGFSDLIIGIQHSIFNLFDVADANKDIDLCHKKLMDYKDYTRERVNEIFDMVAQTDIDHKTRFDKFNTTMRNMQSILNTMNEIIKPGSGQFNSETIHLRLSFLYRALQVKISDLVKIFLNPAYADERDGKYGGNQSSAEDRWIAGDKNELRKIIKKYYPDMSDEEIKRLLNEMSNEGCGYMALTNTIFGAYIGREEEFEKTFGFPMYDKYGNPNYDLVMLDFYCSQGEIDGEISGLNKYTSEDRWEEYMNEKGIASDVVIDMDVTFDNYDEIVKDGEIIISMSPLRIRNEKGDLVDTRDGGHAMVITGVEIVDGKKMYKVSTWGEVRYVDPNDFTPSMRLEYRQVRY